MLQSLHLPATTAAVPLPLPRPIPATVFLSPLRLTSSSTTPGLRLRRPLLPPPQSHLFATLAEEGPIELPPSSLSIFATDDDPTFIQVATSVMLTGAIAVFLFRSIRRRVKRAKELRFRSSGVKKSLADEALDSLKALGSSSIDTKPPSAVQALLGGISAGVIALILYKFTTTIEAALNRQALSDSFSARQITVTVRTIINGLCYLATFVFGLNSFGLFLYSGQLALDSFMGDATDEGTGSKSNERLGSQDSQDSVGEGGKDGAVSSNIKEDEISDSE